MRISSDVRLFRVIKLGIAPGIGMFIPCIPCIACASRMFSGVRLCRSISGFFIISASMGLLRASSWYSGISSIIYASRHAPAPTDAITSGCSCAICTIICIVRLFSKSPSGFVWPAAPLATLPAALPAKGFSRLVSEARGEVLVALPALPALVALALLVALLAAPAGLTLALLALLAGRVEGAERGVGAPHRFGTTVWLEASVGAVGLEKPFWSRSRSMGS